MIRIPQNIIDLKPYVPGRPIDEVKKEYGLEKVIKIASNENPMGPSPMAVQAMLKAVGNLNRYPDIGTLDLREKLSRKYNVPVKNIIAGSGSEGILAVAIRSFMFDDEELLTADGTFIGVYVLANSKGVKLVKVPLTSDYRYDLNAIADRINEKTKIIYLANPNNPTGTTIKRQEFEDFMKYVPDHCLLIQDEAYFEYIHDDPDYPNSLDYRQDNVITLRTFSKAYGLAGIRIGYGFAHEELITDMLKVKLPFEPSIPAKAAGTAALDDEHFVECHLEMNRNGKKFLYGIFGELGLNYIKSDTNFIMIDFGTAENVNRIQMGLLKQGVIVRPLTAFGLPHCIRVTIGLPEENEFFAEALRKVL